MEEPENTMAVLGLGLFTVVLLAFFIERALVIWFDIGAIRTRINSTIKTVVAFVVSLAICWGIDLNILNGMCKVNGGGGVLCAGDNAYFLYWLGIFVTASIVAGGSAGAVKLFQDVLGFSKGARTLMKDVNIAETKAREDEAKAKTAKASAEMELIEADKNRQLARARAEEVLANRETELGQRRLRRPGKLSRRRALIGYQRSA